MADYARLARNAQRILRSKQGKQVGSRVLQQAAGVADGLTKQRYTAKIEQARAAAEKGLRAL